MSFQESGGFSVAIVGATGTIGCELVQQVTTYLPIRKLTLMLLQNARVMSLRLSINLSKFLLLLRKEFQER